MAGELTAPPVLSTPDTLLLSEGLPEDTRNPVEVLSDEQLTTRYEINRTINEIRQRKWKRVALQFPDQMLPHSARVYQLLARGLRERGASQENTREGPLSPEAEVAALSIDDDKPVRLTILGDTSYGSCCVDEVAAEHVDADAVVHYGRACLSPTARLPVMHIFTTIDLDYEAVVMAFRDSFPDIDTKVVLTADVPYAAHVQPVTAMLERLGYSNVFAASIVHDPSSSIPNRTVPKSVIEDPSSLLQWSLFHISEPPTSLLLTLTSRMASVRVYPTDTSSTSASTSAALETSTRLLLRRRYAIVTSLATVPVWGILINTLSVKNYMDILSHIQRKIAAAGKKSYLFVVGKLNPAKLANFSEIGGWIVIGCWESSLVDSKEFYRPIITPFELELALQTDESRLWTGEWRADFQSVLETATKQAEQTRTAETEAGELNGAAEHDAELDMDSESESEPPEFDLRTGRYVSRTRPMQSPRTGRGTTQQLISGVTATQSDALTRRGRGDMVAVNGTASPGAEYLAQKRTWRGLGSDFEVRYEKDAEEEGSVVEEGRTGVARGYTVGESVRM
ncbi:diphthamide biosynthesis protein 2 [Capronia epimyces CBS 606.96]|uniref:2-(3-amino-3-carboxypropyl)histidine synthase subunit 2 n=1 Tax=Capronia epimyces CBS 606.96 TaxID=1182542 RepID=W9XFL6_9EURO|nr:diphthamide biosynthesis protein 2 [Capronia epimyces CBS 606.96]EXJ79297.1 diphthamide biosynthesis protein 2 [Capronia epimyces CBS 606.96]